MAANKTSQHMIVTDPSITRMSEQHPGVLEKITDMLRQLGDELIRMANETGNKLEEVCAMVQWDDTVSPSVVRLAVFDREDQEQALERIGHEDSVFVEAVQKLRDIDPQGLLRVLVVLRSGHMIATRIGSTKQWTAMSKGGDA